MGDMEMVQKKSVRKEDAEMGQRPGKTFSWCKGFVSVLGITIGTVLQGAAWILPVSQADQVPSVKFIQQRSVEVLIKCFGFIFKSKRVCFP